MYSVYLYFLGISLRNTSKALHPFEGQKEVMLLYGIGFNDLGHCRYKTNIDGFPYSFQ